MNSSRFISRATASLHEQRRSVPPPFYIDRRIQIGVTPEPTGGAGEALLALARSTVHCAATRAGLRRIGRIDLDQVSGLVEKQPFDLVPSDIQDGSVEATLLGDVHELGPLGHIFRAQPLDNDSSEASSNVGCGLVRPVLSDSGALGAESGNTTLRFGVTAGAALAAGGGSLSTPDAAVEVSQRWRQIVCGAIGQHKGHGHAPVDANCPARIGHGTFNQASNTDLPTERGSGDRCLSDFPVDWSSVSILDPADFGDADTGPAAVDLLNANLATCKGKGIINALLFWLWVSALRFPRPAIGFIERLEGALQRRHMHGPDEIKISPQCGQLTGLSHVIEVVSRSRLIVSPMVSALLKSEVPDKTADASKLPHGIRLLGCWAKRVCKASVSHIKQYRKCSMLVQYQFTFLPVINDGVSSEAVL